MRGTTRRIRIPLGTISKIGNNPTAAQLAAWADELRRYQAALRQWDHNLRVAEQELAEWEDSLVGEVCECPPECELDDDEDCCYVDERQPQPITTEYEATYQSYPTAVEAPSDEVAWLEALHALPDRRKKKK